MNPWLRLTLVTITVGGGFAGFVIALESLLNAKGQGPLNLLILVFFVALYGFVIASGLIFVQKPRRTRPLLIALAIQVPWISLPQVVYQFAAGFHASVGIGSLQPGTFGLRFGSAMGSTFTIMLLQDKPWILGVNVFALSILIMLLRPVRTMSPAVSSVGSSLLEPDSPRNSVTVRNIDVS